VQVKGSLTLSGSDKLALARAERIREGQSQQTPPFDKPWCFFDLAEIKLSTPSLSVMWPSKAWNRPMRIGREGLSLIVFGCYCRPLTNCLGLRKESLSWSRWCSSSGIVHLCMFDSGAGAPRNSSALRFHFVQQVWSVSSNLTGRLILLCRTVARSIA
jgi:hypothetical protein